MLVLSRRPRESIKIGSDVEVEVLSVRGNRVRLGIRAPRSRRVIRTEVEVRDNDDGVASHSPRVASDIGKLKPLQTGRSVPSPPATSQCR